MYQLVGEGRAVCRIGPLLAALSLLVLVSMGCFRSASASDVELYLAVDGNDANDGLSSSKPLATLQRAHDLLAKRLSAEPARAVVHVAPGRYRGQTVRWSFSMRDYPIVIQGDRRNRPIFDGKASGKEQGRQDEFLNIVRDRRPDDGPSNIQVRGLQIENYLEAIWIRGSRSQEPAYTASDGRNVIEDNRIVDIGGAFVERGKGRERRDAHGAILVRGSRGNIIRNNEFVNITNDSAFPADYSTYGGLHAIYVMRFSSGTIIEGNSFSRVFARGVIKFRHFSNFGKVIHNRFDDDTSLIENAYCDRDLAVCQQLDFIDCPSWGIEFSDNTFRHYRGPTTRRPTLDVSRHPANDNYCNSDRFWTDSKLDPRAPWNQVKGQERVISKGNREVRQ
jgi:hypothetical protein